MVASTRSRLGVAGCVLALLVGRTAAAGQARALDSEVKAVYLLNFGRFAAWPADAPASPTFVVCVLGRDPFGAALDEAVSGERIDGRVVVARRIARPEDAGGCRILFISTSERARVKRDLQVLDGARTLTVSDMPEFVDQDGMIQFVPEGNKVRFAVNVAAAERVGLTFSSELLRVAASVKTARTP